MAEQRSLIRKHIDALSEHGWLAGESFSDYRMEKYRTNTYSSDSIAIDPFRKIGVLQAGYGSGLTVTGVPNQVLAMKSYLPTAKVIYALDIKNNVLSIDTSIDRASVIQSLNATSITNSPRGLEVHRDALYAAANINATTCALVKYSPLSNSPTWNLSYNMSLTAFALNSVANPASGQIQQVLLSWKGNLYQFHGNKVTYCTGNEASPVVLTVGCTFPDNMIAKTACGFGTLIAVGCSDNLVDNTRRANCKIYLYDGFSLDWQKEIPFYDTDITDLVYDGHTLFAYGPSAKWEFDGVGFNRISDIDAVVAHNGADVNGGFVFFQGTNVIRAYGRPNQLVDKAWIRPMTGAGANGIVKWVTASKIYAASSDGNIYRYSSATWETAAVGVTRFFEMPGGENFYIRAVKIGYEPLASGDSVAIAIDDENKTAYQIGTITFATDGTVTPYAKLITEGEFSTAVPLLNRARVRLSLNGGQPKIAFIDLLIETVKEV